MDDCVRLEIDSGIATITLARPEVGNAFELVMAQRLHQVVQSCADDPAVRCVVLTGAGRMFCVGGDVAAMQAAGEGRVEFLDALISGFHEALLALMQLEKPLVTLINGPAAGAGVSLAVVGDVVLAARSASFLAAYAVRNLRKN